MSLECRNAKVPMSLLALLPGKAVQIGAIDVATDDVESAEDVASVIAQALNYVPKDKIIVSTNCGMAPMRPELAWSKLTALGQGAALARQRYL